LSPRTTASELLLWRAKHRSTSRWQTASVTWLWGQWLLPASS